MQTQPWTPPPRDPTDVVGRRIVGYIIDFVPMFVIFWLLVVNQFERADFGSSFAAQSFCDTANEFNDQVCINVNETVYLADTGDFGGPSLAVLAYAFFFIGLLPGFTGWSPGKLVMGLRVVRQDDFTTAGVGPNLLRWLLWVVDSAPWCLPLVGFITGLSTKGHRRVGDMAASTFVVRTADVGQPVAIAGVAGSGLGAAAATGAAMGAAGSFGQPAPGAAPPPPAAAPPPPSGAAWPATPPTDEAAPPPPGADPTVSVPTAPPSAAPTDPTTAVPPAFPPIGDSSTAAPEPTSPFGADPEPPSPFGADPETDAAPSGSPGGTDAGDPGGIAPIGGDAAAQPDPTPPEPAVEDPAPAAEAPAEEPRPGVDAPQWDTARNTYIQWDPELGQWMEWDEANGRWIPIST